MGAFSVIYNIPLFYQVVLNLSSADAGLRLVPNSISGSLGSLGYGILMERTGRYYWLAIYAYAFQFVGTGLLATFNIHTPAWEHFVCILPSGFGFSGSTTLLLVALISSVPVTGFPHSCYLTYNRPSNSHRNELSIPKCRICSRYHDNPMSPPKSPKDMAYKTHS